jgi:vanillate O-demethylase ferredoxin subunit
MVGKIKVKVTRKTAETDEISSYRLEAAGPQPLPHFSPGSHIDVHLPNGLIRQYSLMNTPGEHYQIAVLRSPQGRGGSVNMHAAVQQGDELWISQPRNHFALREEVAHSLLIAGGIGITPMVGMARRLQALGRGFRLHYAARSRSKMAFHDLLAAELGEHAQFHFDDQGGLELAALLENPAADAHLYVCGPKGLIDAVLDCAQSLGWASDRVHYELFAAQVSQADSSGFDIEIQGQGRIVRVPEGVTVVNALAAAGIQIPVSCEQGVCGTCLTRVVEGEPEHRDMYLTDDEKQSCSVFLPCCSRAKSSMLVIAL